MRNVCFVFPNSICSMYVHLKLNLFCERKVTIANCLCSQLTPLPCTRSVLKDLMLEKWMSNIVAQLKVRLFCGGVLALSKYVT